MIDEESIIAILQMYAKHGWILRRVLLSAAGVNALSRSPVNIFGDVEIHEYELDALWFSRRSRPGDETWELRRLSGNPFALVAVISNAESESRESILKDVEARMAEAGNSNQSTSH